MDFFSKTETMGVLNVTPNPSSDGGRYFSLQEAVEYANIRGGKLTLDLFRGSQVGENSGSYFT